MTETAEDTPASRFENRPLLIAWLLAFFPVGLYGLWKGSVFDTRWKIGLTIAVLIVFTATGFRLVHPLYVFVLFPAALVVLFRSNAVARATVYKFGAGWGVAFLLLAVNTGLGGGASDPYGDVGGSCAATFTQNGCTYFRDSDCNVIAKQCE